MYFFVNIEFVNKWYFWLLLLIPVIIYFFYKTLKNWINFIFIEDLKSTFGWNSYMFYIKILLIILIFINFIIIAANPNTTNISEDIEKNGIDIVLALDISWSMEAEDLIPNRIEAAKQVINNFISNLSTDRLWLVVFAWKPFTSIPLTFDYSILEETVSWLWTNNIDQQKRWLSWTAIWDAILMAKTLFKAPKNESDEDYKKREKVIILLTDWDANVWVNPVLAWLSAKKEWIKIYTIWIWSEKWGIITVNDWFFERRIKIPPLNDKDLKQIASDTWWEYFRADNNNTFQTIFDELSKLEKNDINIEIKKEYSEYYEIFLYSLIILLWFFTFIMVSKTELRNNNL